MRLSRAVTFMEKFGRIKGLQLYLDVKFNRVADLKLPGIIHPFTLRKGSSDIAIFDQVFLHGDYDVDFPIQPLTIIDAGANIGLFSILMKNRYPASRIICIEPEGSNFDLLKKNLLKYDKIETLNSALWSHVSGIDTIPGAEKNYSTTSVVESKADAGMMSTTIDEILLKFSLDQIDILKIDIEGAEEIVFSKNYETWLPKVKIIVIELHDWLRPGCSRSFFKAINQCFRKYDYHICGENTIIVNRDLLSLT